MKHTKMLSWLFVLFIILSSCGQKTNQSAKETEVNTSDNGALVFKKYCSACHQANGGGIPGTFPPLAGNKAIGGNNEQLIHIILNGLTGETEVNGEKYNGIMVGFKNLSDQEVADVLNYIKKDLNNFSDFVTKEDVSKCRAKDSN